MIYEYPEEFIIPVIYVDDLKDKNLVIECKILNHYKIGNY